MESSTSYPVKLSAGVLQCGMSNPVALRDKHVKLQQTFTAFKINITDE